MIAVGLVVALVSSDRERTDVTDLVVELGTERSSNLRAALSQALGDPSLEVGYWFEDTGAFVAADGRRVAPARRGLGPSGHLRDARR